VELKLELANPTINDQMTAVHVLRARRGLFSSLFFLPSATKTVYVGECEVTPCFKGWPDDR